MSEWRLFGDEPPEPPASLPGRDWMDLARQPGFAQRSAMVAGLVRLVTRLRPITAVTDLGCGDGALLGLLRPGPGVRMWGYDLGAADVAYARGRGIDAREGDITNVGGVELGDLIIATEVVEHLADPQGFLFSLPTGRVLILSSPSLETGEWHNGIHAWAWDMEGYRDLVERAGWSVAYQVDCDGGLNTFGGVTGPQRFQALVAV